MPHPRLGRTGAAVSNSACRSRRRGDRACYPSTGGVEEPMRVAVVAVATLTFAACATPGGPTAPPAAGSSAIVETPAELAADAASWGARCEQGFAVDCRKLGRAHLGARRRSRRTTGWRPPCSSRAARWASRPAAATWASSPSSAAASRRTTPPPARSPGAPATPATPWPAPTSARSPSGGSAGGGAPARGGRDPGRRGWSASFLTALRGGRPRRAASTSARPGSAARWWPGTCRERPGPSSAPARAGCPLACHRLALLAADAPQAAPDVDSPPSAGAPAAPPSSRPAARRRGPGAGRTADADAEAGRGARQLRPGHPGRWRLPPGPTSPAGPPGRGAPATQLRRLPHRPL